MKKRFLALILIASIATVGVFAGHNLRVSKQTDRDMGLNSNPIYVQIDEDTYKNVETSELFSIDELPEYCKIVGGEGQQDLQRNQMLNSYNQENRNNMKSDDYQQRSSSNRKSSSRNTNSNKGNSARNYQNR